MNFSEEKARHVNAIPFGNKGKAFITISDDVALRKAAHEDYGLTEENLYSIVEDAFAVDFLIQPANKAEWKRLAGVVAAEHGICPTAKNEKGKGTSLVYGLRPLLTLYVHCSSCGKAVVIERFCRTRVNKILARKVRCGCGHEVDDAILDSFKVVQLTSEEVKALVPSERKTGKRKKRSKRKVKSVEVFVVEKSPVKVNHEERNGDADGAEIVLRGNSSDMWKLMMYLRKVEVIA